jgi:integrase
LEKVGKMAKRIATDYPGVFYREVDRIGGNGKERVYYVVFKKNGKTVEAKAGRQFADDTTPSRASNYRSRLLEGKEQLPKEKRESAKAAKEAAKAAEEAELNRWTIARLWEEYKAINPDLKGIVTDDNRFKLHIAECPNDQKPKVVRLGGKEPQDLIPLDIDRLRLRLEKHHKPGTVKNTLELLRRIINFGVKKQLCEGPSFKIELPTVHNIKTEDLTPEQLTALLQAIEHEPNIQPANFMKLVLFSGMRRGELFKLKWSHIDFERGFINIIDPKGGSSQKIPLNSSARELLLNHPRSQSEYVFPGRNGRRRVDISKQVNRIKKAAGLPKDFRPLHGLRHVYASMLASSGQVDMYTLQKLLTHKSPLMTQRYAHLRDEALRKASELAGDIINQAITVNDLEHSLRLVQ